MKVQNIAFSLQPVAKPAGQFGHDLQILMHQSI